MARSRGRPEEIALVETAYRLDLPENEWLRGLAGALERVIEAPMGAHAYRYDTGPGGERHIFSWVGSDWLKETHRRANLMAPREVWELFHRSGTWFSTTSDALRTKLGVDVRKDPRFRSMGHPSGIYDFFSFSAAKPDRSGIVVGAPLGNITRASARDVRVFTRVAIHVAAALRLRDALGQADDLAAADAVLRPDGKVEHAEAPARERLDSLREAAARVALARGESRRDPERALELWQGLVSGTWSLIDHFDTDGRRFVVARKNDPEVRDPRALTARERQVVHCAAVHGSNKLIAYELGLSPSTVATVLQRAMRKLGASSRAELIRLARALGPSAEDEGRR